VVQCEAGHAYQYGRRTDLAFGFAADSAAAYAYNVTCIRDANL
jgi:hypothetical protein